MTAREFSLFETAIGCCGIAWGARGIVGVQLPERDATKTRARLLRRFPDAREAVAPAPIQRIIEDIIALLGGARRDFRGAALDLTGIPDFHRRVYHVARTIPAGATLSYGEIATRLGDRLLARDVGQALSKNPFPIIIPCHRVLAAGGKSGGFSANGGVATKLRLLSIERAQPTGPTLFDDLPLVRRI